MTNSEIRILYAKDKVVEIHGNNILLWSKETWESTVTGMLEITSDLTLKQIKEEYNVQSIL